MTTTDGTTTDGPPLDAGRALYRRAKAIIPGGTQLLSKRPEMFAPDRWPPYYDSARGVEIVDLDGNRFIDMTGCGIGATALGYADPDVDGAVTAAIARGSMSTLNPHEEVACAELLLGLHPWADMVRFARAGGEAMAIAVRIARAATGRDEIAFCGYHGWHDWYLSANLSDGGALDQHLLPGLDPAGVPRGLSGLMHPFHYNRLDELERVFTERTGRIAAVVMEPTRSGDPAPGFLEGVRRLCDRAGAALVFDEITTGFRLTCGGAHLTLGVEPDIAVFAKALANGYPMSAVIGRRAVMDAAQKTFVSSTAWTERIGPVAALATMCKHRDHAVAAHLLAMGRRAMTIWQDAAHTHGLPVTVGGVPSLARFAFDHPEAQALRTLYTRRMLDHGFLSGATFYPMYAHTDDHLAAFALAVHAVFAELSAVLETGGKSRLLPQAAIAHKGFGRLTDAPADGRDVPQRER